MGLPGGLLHPQEDPCRGALRELEEELGVCPEAVRCLGPLTPLRMFVSRLELQPWLCVAVAEPEFCPDAREVEQQLFCSLGQLCDPAQRRIARRQVHGTAIDVPGWQVQGHFVWGATALVLAEVAAVVSASGSGS